MHLSHTLSPVLAATLLAFSAWLASAEPPADNPPIDFAREIRPLLSDRCFTCHGPDENDREADLRLDQIESMLADRGGYQVVAPGVSSQSELVRRVYSDDESEVMPPPETGKPLSETEKAALKLWIEQGAKWRQHWAYETPSWHPIPVSGAGRIGDLSREEAQSNWIDAFITRKHVDAGALFSGEADRVTLIRRLSFDIVGLPPDERQVLKMVESESPAVINEYIERLLASPAFGERLASYWLDLVRYADTVGYHGDQDHSISPYRDYVINALNDGLSFKQFTIEQLAGDLLDSPTEEQIVATGYNRLLQTSHEGGVQPKEYLTIYQADRVRNLSAVWFGATIGCAQCHDHKYDPYRSSDFYALAAFFADVDEAQHFKVGSNALPTKRPPERNVLSRSQRLLLEKLQIERDELLTGKLQESETGPRLDKAIKRLKDSGRMSMITVSIKPREVRLLPRGNWLDDSGPIMSPAVPAFLGTVAARRAGATTGGNPDRLDLALWLTDTEHGAGLLTARVMVNRLWMVFFGYGLSRSVEDLGGQGEAPSHPELLDNLAVEFVRSGWDLKHMVRLITGSRTYRQSSLETGWHRTHDPLNRLLARQNRFRLPAEMIRDAALETAGLLVQRTGGASVRPYQPVGYYKHLNFPTRKYQMSEDVGQWRRGLYVHWQRQFLHPMLRAFDAPQREECTAQRPQSNTPLGALVWLNDPSFVEAARGLAFRGLELDGSDDERLDAIFRLGTSRKPDQKELTTLQALLANSRKHFELSEAEANALLNVGMYQHSSDVQPVELAAWTTVARAVLNLSETYTRN